MTQYDIVRFYFQFFDKGAVICQPAVIQWMTDPILYKASKRMWWPERPMEELVKIEKRGLLALDSCCFVTVSSVGEGEIPSSSGNFDIATTMHGLGNIIRPYMQKLIKYGATVAEPTRQHQSHSIFLAAFKDVSGGKGSPVFELEGILSPDERLDNLIQRI